MWVSVVLLIAYASACGVATFVENDFGTPSAKALIYSASWFDVLHLLLVLNLIGVILYSRAWQRKKYASLLFHSSLVVIFIGAAITRYYGFEGIMHIREGQSSSSIESADEFLTILAKVDDKLYRAFFPTTITPLVQKKFNHTLPFKDGILDIKFLEYIAAKDKMDADKIKVLVSFNNENIELVVSKNTFGEQVSPLVLGGEQFALDWGSRSVSLPFAIKLNDFILDRYAGSMSPSSYKSKVVIVDSVNGVEREEEIFMNNVLDYGGYRFFQSSYDQDEGGTILSVNRDPGKIPTYIGYAMLTLGLLWAFFAKNGRFYRLSRFLKEQNLSVAFALGLSALMLSAPALAETNSGLQNTNSIESKIDMHGKNGETLPQGQNLDSTTIEAVENPHGENFEIPEITNESILDLIKNLKEKSAAHSEIFSRLIVQDFGGRMKPVDTLAMEYIHKITKKDGFLGLSNLQIFLGMMVYPNEFRKVKMIAISTPKLKEIIGVGENEKYIAFEDLFSGTDYKLANYLEDANRKKPALRDKFDKDVIAVDERVNVAFLIYTAQSLRIIPNYSAKVLNYLKSGEVELPEAASGVDSATKEAMIAAIKQKREAESKKWLSPSEAIAEFEAPEAEQLQKLFSAYFNSFHYGLVTNNWENANLAVEALGSIQTKYGENLLPSKARVDLEIFLNNYNVFKNLILPYILCGILLFSVLLVQIFRHKKADNIASKGLHYLIALLVLIHTIALGVRWYVGGHAPWSNAYESMIYIAWAAGISAVVFFRKSYLAQSMASFLAGISLFVAHLGFMDPQIGNLVPVLKSYWLNIHVSIITASYGFLGLCFMLGALSLLLYNFRSTKFPEIDKTILTLHTINEMAMILGLAMLTVGNFLGGVWANESWGRYWGWDPKETWALISIVVYVIVLHVRFIPKGDNPYIFASLSVVAFYSILMTYFGVNFYLSGLHSYAAGDPLPIPVFLYYFVAATIILIISAARKSDLSAPKLPS